MGKKKWFKIRTLNYSEPVPMFPRKDFDRELEFNNRPPVPPSNSLYPEPAPPSKSSFNASREDSFTGGNIPPWHARRSEFGSKQARDVDSAPWNRSSRPGNWGNDRPDWNEDQQGPNSARNNEINYGGFNQGNERFINDKEPSSYRDNRDGGPREERWNDRQMSNERNEWNNMTSQSRNPQGYYDSNQNKSGENYPPQWSNQPPNSRENINRFQRPDEISERRQEDWIRRNQSQHTYDEPIRQAQPQWEDNAQERDWKSRQESFRRDEWKDERQRQENRAMSSQNQSNNWSDDRMRRSREPEWTSHQKQDLGNRNWSDSSRNHREGGWNRESRSEDTKWSEGSGARDYIRRRNRFLDVDLIPTGLPIFNSNNEPSRREYGRKRERSPMNQDVWSRLEPKGGFISDSVEFTKRLKLMEHLIDNKVNMESEFRGPVPLFSKIHNEPPKDIILQEEKKSLTSSPREERKSFEVIICPRNKKSKFSPKDKDDIEEKLVNALHNMAKSDDVTSVPQLRFDGVKMISRTRLVVKCHDAETAKWLLWWNLGKTRFPVRTILPEDPAQLAIIGFTTKALCDLAPFEMKVSLKTQNPSLDISKWVEGESTMKKKGRSYIYQVDGHTLRYLVNNKWELYFDMYKLHVTRIKTNFYFNPLTFTRL